MPSKMRIDQVGLSAGVAGMARNDGLSTGAEVTITDTNVGGTAQVSLLYHPAGDVGSDATLHQVSALVWKFTPTPGVTGPWRILLRHTDAGGATSEEVRIFGIPDGSGFVPAAPNERSSELATLANATDPNIIAACERNWPTADFPAGNPFGWAFSVAGGASGAVGGDLSGALPNPNVTRARGLKTATTTVSVSAAAAPSPGQVLTATDDHTANWQSPAASAPTTLQEAYTAGATIALSATDLAVTISSENQLNLGSATAIGGKRATASTAAGDAAYKAGKGFDGTPSNASRASGSLTVSSELGGAGAATVNTSGANSGNLTIVSGTGGSAGSSGATPGAGGDVLLQAGASSGGTLVGVNLPINKTRVRGGDADTTLGGWGGDVEVDAGKGGSGGKAGQLLLATDAVRTRRLLGGDASNGVPLEWRGSLFTPLLALTDGATVTVPLARGDRFSLTIGGNRTLDASFPAEATAAGQRFALCVTQDGTGGRTLAFAAKYVTMGDVSLNSSANAVTWFFAEVVDSTHIYILRGSLENVTNDAQLKRSGSDWGGFTAQTSMATGDTLLIERASDGAKRKLTANYLASLSTLRRGALWMPPVTPNANDEEFDSGALPSGWGWYKEATPWVSQAMTSGLDLYAGWTTGNPHVDYAWRGSQVAVITPYDNNSYCLMKSFTLPTDGFFWTRVGVGTRTASSAWTSSDDVNLLTSFVICPDSGGVPSRASSHITITFVYRNTGSGTPGVYYAASGLDASVNRGTAGTSPGSNAYWLLVGDAGPFYPYFGIQKIGTTYRCMIGDDAGNTIYLGGPMTVAATLSWIGVVFREHTRLSADTAFDPVKTVDFIRHINTPDGYFGMGQ